MFTISPRPQGYKVIWYNAFRYLDLKEGSDGAHLIASVKPFQTLGPEYEMHFWLCKKDVVIRHFRLLLYIKVYISFSGNEYDLNGNVRFAKKMWYY